MKQNDVMAAIEILKRSNTKLQKYIYSDLPEAIKKIQGGDTQAQEVIVKGYEVIADCKAEYKAVELAISALEKQLLKPPEHKVHERYKALGKNYYCSCGVMFVDWENQPTNYCGNCGQKLKEE